MLNQDGLGFGVGIGLDWGGYKTTCKELESFN